MALSSGLKRAFRIVEPTMRILESPSSLQCLTNTVCAPPMPALTTMVRHRKDGKPKRRKVGLSWFEAVGDPPVLNVEEIEDKLQSDPDLRYRPIRPARTFETASVFDDPVIRKFTHMFMVHSDQEVAREVMRRTLRNIKRIQFEKMYKEADEVKRSQILLNPAEILHKALANATPVMQLRPLKRGGITYQVPAPISDKKAQWTAIKWMILAAREKGSRDKMWETLAWHLVDAAGNEGRVVKRKQDLHRQCEANKAYAHYRWARLMDGLRSERHP